VTRRPSNRWRAIATVALLITAASWFPQLSSNRAGAATPAFSKTETITRSHVVPGQPDDVADTRTVSLNVDVTTELRDRQQIQVTWSGAHPTGGVTNDPNNPFAATEEYPMVLMECRGVDSSAVPVAQQISPETCWTQTASERYDYAGQDVFPPWRLDRYATADDRGPSVGRPSPLPKGCQATTSVDRWVPFVGADGTVYPGGSNGCGGIPPEGVTVIDPAAPPGNTTYAATDTSGNGAAKFTVWNSQSNASLGCSDTVPCAMVAIPIMGTSCDAESDNPPASDMTGCEATGLYEPGSAAVGTGGGQLAVTGALWWTASNWRNRITVPLNFAPPANVCDILNNSTPLDLYGSPLMSEATEQWAPSFCTNPSLFKFQHVQTAEPEARNLLDTGSIEAALTSEPEPGGYSTPTVNAPIAATGFVVSFDVDDQAGNPVSSLKLTPRLLAKLLTESYPSLNTLKSDAKALAAAPPDGSTAAQFAEWTVFAHNPVDIVLDPEFQALNPGLITNNVAATEVAATILVLSGGSDITYALTSYINADPEARAWLNGTPDPWGMTVNPNYEGIQLPVDNWPLLDSFLPPSLLNSALGSYNPCLQASPVGFLPLVASPTSQLTTITLDAQYGIANSQTDCSEPIPGSATGAKLVAIGREPPGSQFLLTVTSYGDAARYRLNTAALETQSSADPSAKITDASGRTFVTPSPASLEAAARMLQPDSDAGVWDLPYGTLRTDPGGAGAYPGTMLVYAAVPTTGLPATDAAEYATWLRFAAGAGQVSGTANGQLPDGFLPLTAQHGLGTEAAYTVTAAAAVAAQSGVVPPLTPQPSVPSTPVPSEEAVAPAPAFSVPAVATVPSDSAPPSSGGADAATATSPPKTPAAGPVAVGRTVAFSSSLSGLALPVVALLAIISGLAAVALYCWPRLTVRRQ
jgi:hypothetical protein